MGVPTLRLTRSSPLTVGALFLAAFAVLDAVVLVVHVRYDGWAWLARATNAAAGGLLAAVGVPVTLGAREIFLQNHTLRMDLDCTALFAVVLFAALVVAYPFSAGEKARALAVGVPVILAANLARLLGVGLLSEYAPAYFEPVHDFLFQAGMVLVVAALWVLWLADVKRRAR